MPNNRMAWQLVRTDPVVNKVITSNNSDNNALLLLLGLVMGYYQTSYSDRKKLRVWGSILRTARPIKFGGFPWTIPPRRRHKPGLYLKALAGRRWVTVTALAADTKGMTIAVLWWLLAHCHSTGTEAAGFIRWWVCVAT
jgi:hypothetical protein